MKGPGLFSDIGKKAKDLLNRDYTCDQKLTISTCSGSGLGLTSAAVNKGGHYTFDVSSQYKHKNTLIDVKVDTDSNISTTVTISDVLPYTKAIATFKIPDYHSRKLELQYFHDHASIASVVGLKQSPVVELSATLGTRAAAFGIEAGFDTASGNLAKYTLGAGFTKPEYNASIILEDKLDTLRASYVHHLDAAQKTSVVAEIVRQFSANKNIVTVGGQYSIDPQTSVKARLNNSGKFAALLQHELKPKSVLTLSSDFDAKALEKAPKFGLALALKP
ncbi:mitochondrial outer membrane protein porin 5-like isoform X1 [Curcuma longa]|uniref:mitochondrial outer membrane protein porin 5-like isoform X1 n=1 Tax=Curcuma longa TaxID=136217 RepID=UPI003D9F30A0